MRRIGRPIDLLQMDVQGLEVEVLKGGAGNEERARCELSSSAHMASRFIRNVASLQAGGYTIEIDQPDTKEQPDGILVARK